MFALTREKQKKRKKRTKTPPKKAQKHPKNTKETPFSPSRLRAEKNPLLKIKCFASRDPVV
jgi:hypothetical protein